MKILVVDDSIVFRSSISTALAGIDGIEVYKSVANGKIAVDVLKLHGDIDLITLDMEMPVLDGLSTIHEIRKFNKDVVIIVFSSFTQKGAEKTIEALNAGANDFVTKPDSVGSIDDSLEAIKIELLPKIIAFKERSKNKSKAIETHSRPVARTSSEFSSIHRPGLIAIGCSTGGPEALGTIFKQIKSPINVPMLIVQHMPPMFTEKLAQMLTKLSPIEVKEARDGDMLKNNLCYIAPGDYHMVIEKDGKIRLNQKDKVCFVRPSVDVLFNSLAENFSKNILTFVLTGMGEDGAVGAKNLSMKGANIFIQDKDSSVVWGMPGAVKKQVESSREVSLAEVASIIEKTSSL